MRTRGLHAFLLAGAAALAVAGIAPAPAHADGGGGGGGGGTPAAAADPDFNAGVDAWKRKDWAETIKRMSIVIGRDARNADAWNYRAYSYRKSGDMQRAFHDYEQALKIDPRHRGAHEYIGEAYLEVGDLPHAEEHLAILNKLCFFPCEEFSDLKEKVADYKRDHAQK